MSLFVCIRDELRNHHGKPILDLEYNIRIKPIWFIPVDVWILNCHFNLEHSLSRLNSLRMNA